VLVICREEDTVRPCVEVGFRSVGAVATVPYCPELDQRQKDRVFWERERVLWKLESLLDSVPAAAAEFFAFAGSLRGRLSGKFGD
jgi:hypothetical protein